MFCDQCGAHLQVGQRNCVQCGKLATVVGEPGRNRVRDHVKMVALLWWAYSSLHMLGAVGLFLMAKFVAPWLSRIPNPPPPGVMQLIPLIVSVVGGLIVIKSAVGFAVGWGLLQRESWGRMLALVMGFLVTLNVPIGTYTLWVLLPSQSETEYRAMAAAA